MAKRNRRPFEVSVLDDKKVARRGDRVFKKQDLVNLKAKLEETGATQLEQAKQLGDDAQVPGLSAFAKLLLNRHATSQQRRAAKGALVIEMLDDILPQIDEDD